jgi:uncharacterized membrane protein HdeD (DUF308 family)
MNEGISLESASKVMREAMREAIKRYSIWYVVRGGLMMLAGAFAFMYPILPSSAVPLLLGWLMIVSGAAQGVSVIGARNVPHFWVQVLSVAVSVIIGIMFLRIPGERLFLLTVLLIAYFISEGISKLILSLTIRPLHGWQWVLCSGLLGIMAAILTWSKLPVTAIWILCPLLGILLLGEGAAIGYLGWQARKV